MSNEFTYGENRTLPNIFPSKSRGIFDKMSADGNAPVRANIRMNTIDTLGQYILIVELEIVE